MMVHAAVAGSLCGTWIVVTVAYANPIHDALKTMSSLQQAEALGRFVEITGDACTGMKAAFKGMTSDGTARWRVDCSNGQSYLVVIENDPEASFRMRVLSCAVVDHPC